MTGCYILPSTTKYYSSLLQPEIISGLASVELADWSWTGTVQKKHHMGHMMPHGIGKTILLLHLPCQSNRNIQQSLQ